MIKYAKPFEKIDTFDRLYVVTDFDRTLTVGNSKTSWSLLSDTSYLPESYKQERQAYYDYYRPIEVDTSLPFSYRLEEMKEWYHKHIELFVKYQLKEAFIKSTVKDANTMQFRPGAKEFLIFLHERHIPLIIISAGIGNFIASFLEQEECYFDNIYISSNQIKFENGIAVGVEDNIIHSLNKNEVSLPDAIKEKIKGRDQILLLGDQIEDTFMVEEEKRDHTLRVGFLLHPKDLETFKQYFDVVLENDTSYQELGNLLFKTYKN